jgi:hypothetical protein
VVLLVQLLLQTLLVMRARASVWTFVQHQLPGYRVSGAAMKVKLAELPFGCQSCALKRRVLYIVVRVVTACNTTRLLWAAICKPDCMSLYRYYSCLHYM